MGTASAIAAGLLLVAGPALAANGPTPSVPASPAPSASQVDKGRDREKLRQILDQPRYRHLNAAPSPLDRFRQWLADQLGRLFGQTGQAVLGNTLLVWLIIVLGCLLISAFLYLLLAAAWRGRRRSPEKVAQQRVQEVAADHFREADLLAAGGDQAGALRSLVHGVATQLSGRPFWDTSPLTVRELFSGWPRPQDLQPLLLPFEAAVYGHRPPDAATYEAAARAAAAFRSGPAI